MPRIDRYELSELSSARLLSAMSRRVQDIPDHLAWTFPSNKIQSIKERLASFQDKHKGERAFILGNGPSLARMELSALKNVPTFGLNRIYLLFEQLTFLPTYYVCVNELVLEQFSSEISSLSMPKFVNWNRRSFFDINDTSFAFLRLSLSFTDGFNLTPYRAFFSGGTVTYIALQLAYIMGFSEVVLIGVDHSFVDKGTPNKVETRNSDADLNHFHPDYFPKGIKWQLPDLYRSELAYALARQMYEADGRRILDATVNGKCTVFEKVEFKSLF